MSQTYLGERKIEWHKFKYYGLKSSRRKVRKKIQLTFNSKGMGVWHKNQRKIGEFFSKQVRNKTINMKEI
jgi:hypothetical protein